MNKTLEANGNVARNESGDNPNAPKVQGKGLQMNDNSVAGKKPAKSHAAPEMAVKPNVDEVQGKGLQVNENSAGK